MKDQTIKEAVKRELANGNWMFGGILAMNVGLPLKHKAEVVGRRLREYESGKGSNGACEKFLVKRFVPNPNGKGAPVVQYKLLFPVYESYKAELPRHSVLGNQLSMSF